MPSGTVEISKYLLSTYSNGYESPALIALHRANGTLLAWLRFFPPESTMPRNTVSSRFPSSGYAMVSYPISSYAATVDILRNEKPVYFYYNDGSSPYGTVSTSAQEPVGEEESS